MDASPCGFQSWMFWGLITQVQVLEVVVLNVRLVFHKEVWGFEIFPCCG